MRSEGWDAHPNGSFDMRTLSIIETAPVDSRSNPFDDDKDGGVRMRPPTAIDLNPRETIRQLPLQGVFADLTSRHEHNHFVTHCSGELGVLLTLLLIMHHEQRKTIFLSGTTDPPFIESLRITEQVIECLLSSSTTLTQGEAVDVMNRFYSLTFGVAPFTTLHPALPACPSGILGYGNLLESSAVLVEHSYFDIQSPSRGEEEDLLLRSMQRDPVSYLILPTVLIEKLGSIEVASIATARALECRVPLIVSELNGPIHWDNFHPGYRLYKLVESYPKREVEYAAALRTEAPDNWKLHIRSYNYLIGCYDLFGTIAREGYGMPMWEEGQPLISVEAWLRKGTSPFRSFLARRYEHGMWKGVMDHLVYSFNAFRTARTTGFLQLSGAHQVYFFDDQLDGPPLRGMDLTGAHPSQASNALFSVIGGEFRSTYFDAKLRDVAGGICMMIEGELLEGAIAGLGKMEAVARAKALGRFQNPDVQRSLDQWIETVASEFFRT